MEYFDIDFVELNMPLDSTGRSMHAEDHYVRHMLLNVPSGKAQVEKSTQSRFNTANVDVAICFVNDMIVRESMPPQNIRLLTFYNAQRRRYINATLELAEQLHLNIGELDDMVHTADSFQGCKEKCVVRDLVTTHYGGPDTMGHAGNEVKANTAYTRAQECIFIVGNLKSSRVGHKGRIECVLESLMNLCGRNAFKDFGTDEVPEEMSGVGVVFEKSEDARLNRFLIKGVRGRDPGAESDGDDLVERVSDLAISVNGHEELNRSNRYDC